MNWRTRIEVNPEILVGKPSIKGTRLANEFILDVLAGGCSEEEILRNYPGFSREDILACVAVPHEHAPCTNVSAGGWP